MEEEESRAAAIQFYQDHLKKWMIEKTGAQGTDINAPFAGNDWMLIVKLHAMVEAGLNSALLAHLREPELQKVISKLDTSNTSIGKVAFAKALKIISNNSAVFIQKLSEMRNFCVHDIKNFDFNLATYLDSLEEGERNKIHKLISNEIKPEFNFQWPNGALMAAAINVMTQLHFDQIQCELRDLTAKKHQWDSEELALQRLSNPKE